MTKVLCCLMIAVLLLPLSSSATKIARKPIAELLKQADYVALIRVDSGETVWAESSLCGARYKAKVLDPIKGVALNDILEFGRYTGLEIGNSYLVFVAKQGKRFDPIMSTNSFSEERSEAFEKVCASVLQGNSVIHSGFGAMKIVSGESGLGNMVIIRGLFVELPDTLRTEPVEKIGLEFSFEKDVLVSSKDLIDYLKSLH